MEIEPIDNKLPEVYKAFLELCEKDKEMFFKMPSMPKEVLQQTGTNTLVSGSLPLHSDNGKQRPLAAMTANGECCCQLAVNR